jgi:hypothetical protein
MRGMVLGVIIPRIINLVTGSRVCVQGAGLTVDVLPISLGHCWMNLFCLKFPKNIDY